MKSFKLKYDRIIKLLPYATTLVAIGVLVLDVLRFIDNGGFKDFYSNVTYLILLAVAIVAPVLTFSVIYNSEYIITEKELIAKQGFIKSSYSVKDITELVYDKAKRKLAVYSGEEFMVFTVNDEWIGEMVGTIRLYNKKFLYNETESEEAKKPAPDEEEKDKK